MTPAVDWLAGQAALVAGSGGAADAVAAALVAAGASVTRGDAGTDAAAIEPLFAGGIDLLVHAGVPSADAAPETVDLATWRDGFSADIDSRFLHAAAFARARIAARQPGSILFLMPSPAPEAGQAAGGSAQGALDNLVKSLAVEWARDGIRINAIASRVCTGGSGEGLASLGHLAAYLLSDYAAYVTGCVMGVDET